MSLLVISPDFASHYGPLAVLAGAASEGGERVVVATGTGLRNRVESDGFEWRLLQLGASSNIGVVAADSATQAFIAATKAGALATMRYQACKREHDLLWRPEQVAREIAALCAEIDPDEVLVDQVSFGSTLAMRAIGRSFISLVPGHPSQLTAGRERYGIPSTWPAQLEPDPADLAEVEAVADRVTTAFTARWNAALSASAPGAGRCDDALRVHGRRVLFNSVEAIQDRSRWPLLPKDHRFVGPLVRDEALPDEFAAWRDGSDGRAQVYVSLGTFLSHRSDVLRVIVDALRVADVRAAVAVGDTCLDSLGEIPPDWFVARQLPQVAMLGHADLAIHHGGNNSVQESLASGVRQIVLPFSTDQFANAADLERCGLAVALDPNTLVASDFAATVGALLSRSRPAPHRRPSTGRLLSALFD